MHTQYIDYNILYIVIIFYVSENEKLLFQEKNRNRATLINQKIKLEIMIVLIQVRMRFFMMAGMHVGNMPRRVHIRII